MQVRIADGNIEIHLNRAQKIAGLMRDIKVPLADVHDVEVVAEPVREAMSVGMKAGLRLPWLYYVARTIRLDQAFVVRRGVPGLSFRVRNDGHLRRVIVSTPDAETLAAQLKAA